MQPLKKAIAKFTQKSKWSWAVMVHTFNPRTQETQADRSLSLSSRTARATLKNPVSKKALKGGVGDPPLWLRLLTALAEDPVHMYTQLTF